MNLHSKFAWVRVAGLVSVLGLGACDSGTETKDAKKAEPVKAPEPAKVEPVKPPEPAKVEPEVKAPDTKAGDSAGDVKAGDSAGDAKAGDSAGDVKAGDTKAGDTKAPDAKDAKDTPAKGDAKKPTETKATIDGKPLYEAKCKSCHGLDGKGTEAMKKKDIPDLTDKAWQTGHSKAKVIDAVTKGIDGTPMKAFKDKLKPEEIEAIAAYVKKFK